MTTGYSTYSDISTLIDVIREGAMFTLRQQNLLVPTVTVFRDNSGMQPRTVSNYGTANPRVIAEADDVLPTQFDRTAGGTITPTNTADQFFLSDQRIRTDNQNVRADAALELGASFAQAVDVAIAANFVSLTGGTIGGASSALTWSHIEAAYAILRAAKVPPPYFCALHPYQVHDLVLASSITGTGFQNAPGFQDRMANSYMVSTLFGDIIFVNTPSIALSGTSVRGAMYSPLAMAYDERDPFTIEYERDASRQGWELNAHIWYVTGVWAAERGVILYNDATTPTGA